MNRPPKSAILLTAGLLVLALGGYRAGAAQRTSNNHFRQLHIDDDSLSWREDGRSLRLRNGDDGIVVEAARPAPMLGLREGDAIVAVDGHGTTNILQLRDALRGLDGGDARLSVRSGDGTLRDLRLAGHDYAGWLSIPPPPPPPPSPPSPPAPPAG